MTWTRLDDNWTEQQTIAGLSFEARWHYLCLIQSCSRSDRYDGKLRLVDSLRCSDVPDPKAAMNEIHRAGLVRRTEDRQGVVLVDIENHVPPVSVRTKTERDKLRKRRQRLHEAGDHSTCYRQRCEFGVMDEPKPHRPGESESESHVQSPVMSHVTPGQDGTGQDGTEEGEVPEQVNLTTGEVPFDDDEWATGYGMCSTPGCTDRQTSPEGRRARLCPRHMLRQVVA